MRENLVRIIDREMRKHAKHVKIIGFDLDGTLIPFRHRKIFDLVWETVLGYLDNYTRTRLGRYSFEELSKNQRFGFGWFLDNDFGFYIQTDPDGKIIEARRGVQVLTSKAISKAYGNNGIIDISQTLDPDEDRPRFMPCCDALDYIEAVIVSAVRGIKGLSSQETIVEKIIKAFRQAHKPEGFKKELVRNPKDFGIEPNPELQRFLDFLAAHYDLFLLTSSHNEYTNTMLEYLGIADYFSMIISGAKKPACFHSSTDDHKTLMEKLNISRWGKSKRILYVGDHLYKDAIYAQQAGILTALVVTDEQAVTVERKLLKYGGIEFKLQGQLRMPKQSEKEVELLRMSNFLALIYRHVGAIVTYVPDLRPLLSPYSSL